MISLKDYEAAIEYVVNFINKFPKHLTPEYIIQNGHINNLYSVEQKKIFKELLNDLKKIKNSI